jgi:iron(III) transport system ATP-binding protein
MVEVEFQAVTKQWNDGSYAVRELSFVAPAGRLTTVLGPSGCGKSTLLRMAAGLEQPTAGRVLVDGRDISALSPDERSVSMLFQSGGLFPHLDVIGNVGFGLRVSGLPEHEVQRRARGLLGLVGLAGMERRSTNELSGGEQQRVALARALALEPSVVLLDEPLSNLDVGLRHQLRDEIRSLQQRLGVTMAYVTHDEAEAMAVSDFIVVMNEGRLQQMGTPRDVYEHPNSEFVAAFMGDAAVFDVEAAADGSVRLGPFELQLRRKRPDGPLRVMVRPEAWRILAAGADGLPGRIERCAYLGHGVEYLIDTDLGALLVSTDNADALHQPGAPVTLMLGQRGVSVFDADARQAPQQSGSAPGHPTQNPSIGSESPAAEESETQ